MKPKTKSANSKLADLRRLKARLSSSKAPAISEAEAVRRLRVTEAARAQLKLKREEGELVPVKEVKTTLCNFIVNAKSRLLFMSNALAPRLALETDEAKCKAMIDGEVRQALTDLSTWDPAA